jgi:PKHD-type hydroxylase
VIALGEARPRMAGRVEVGAEAYRASHIAWIEPSTEAQWLFHRVGMLFALANRHFGLQLVGMVDAIQYTSYGASEHFDWHMDLGPGQTSARKLSLTIQLSADDAYAGGDLEFINAPSRPEGRRRGTATFFPSYLAHRVSPIRTGLRRSLVAWASGDAFA